MLSFTMLTVNADAHPLMREFHKPEDEKRMVVVLPQAFYAEWLDATVSQSVDLIQSCPLPDLVVTGDIAPKPSSTNRSGIGSQSTLF